MKNGKKPTLAQKKFLQDTGLDSEKWLIVKDTPEEMVIVSRIADVLDYSSKERMEETLKNTTKVFKDSLAVAIQSRLKGKTPEGLGGAASAENLLRDQIARNVRGL